MSTCLQCVFTWHYMAFSWHMHTIIAPLKENNMVWALGVEKLGWEESAGACEHMKCKLNIMGMCHPYAISLRNGVWPRETTLRVAFCCSCPVGSFPCSRTQVIEEDFCEEYSSSDVYTARVVGATCNCIPASGDANLQCQDYGAWGGWWPALLDCHCSVITTCM